MTDSIGSHPLDSIADIRRLFSFFFEHAPTAFQIFAADGRSLVVNQAFRELFGSEPPADYNVLEDDIAKRSGFLDIIHRAFKGETIRVPPQWYDARDLRSVQVNEGRRVAIEITLFPLRDASGAITHVAHSCKDVTAEHTLARERAEIDATLNSIGDAVIATDTQGRVVRMNPVAERLTGWSLAEARGVVLPEVFRILNERTRQVAENPVERVLRDGNVVGLANHTVLVAKDGTEYPIADSGAPIRGAEGAITGVVLVFHDKTEEAKAERALRESEERFRLLHDLALAVESIEDPEQIMPTALRVLGTHLGVSRCAFAHMDPDGNGFTIPYDFTIGCASIVGRYELRSFGPRALGELQRGETLVVRNVDAELTRADGADTFNSIEIKAIICCSLVRGGVIRALMAVHQTRPRDWTQAEIALVQEVVERCWSTIEQRASEARLQRSEALLRIAGKTARLGGWVVEIPSSRVTWSDEVCAIHELPPGTSPTLENAIEFYAPEYRTMVLETIGDCFRDGTPFDFETELLTAKQRRIWVRAIGSAERDSTGTVVRIQGAFQEITEQKRTDAQLMASDRMASVGMLAAGVAHEINNPLTAIVGNLALASQDLTDSANAGLVLPDLIEHVRDAAEGAERVRLIVRDIMVFSRAEEDRRGSVNIESVLDSTIRLAWNEVRHRARLVKVYGHVPSVDGNESRLGQVFLNLIVNAAQSIPEGNFEGNEVRIQTRIGNAGQVVVSVRDTGSGMSREVQRRLFTPFFSTKPIGVGTGLGLSICHRIVTSMGGTIEATSTEGQGSEFLVMLPIATTSVSPIPTLAPPPDQLNRRGSILIVDDEVMIGQTLTRILSKQHEAIAVESAQQALALLRAGRRFDIIFCDVMMPQTTGMDLYAAILEFDATQAARVVFMTGGAFTATAHAFLDASLNPRIEKPFDVRKLRALVQDCLRANDATKT